MQVTFKHGNTGVGTFSPGKQKIVQGFTERLAGMLPLITQVMVSSLHGILILKVILGKIKGVQVLVTHTARANCLLNTHTLFAVIFSSYVVINWHNVIVGKIANSH